MENQIPQEKTPLSDYSNIDNVPISLLGQMSSYWRAVIDSKKRQHDVSTKRIIIGQLITIFVVGVSSLLIEESQEAFLLVGATLLLYPALTDLLMSSGSVLSASVHHDLERQDESTYRFSLLAVLRSIAGTIIAGSIVGSVAGAIAAVVLDLAFLATLQLAVLSASIASVIGLPLVLGITLIARNMRSNPDEVIPPFESSVFNVVMLLAIAVSSRILA